MAFAKKIIFWIAFVPLAIIMLGFEAFNFFASVTRAISEVIQIIFTRFEYWAFNVDREIYFNSPYKKTLKEYFIEELDR